LIAAVMDISKLDTRTWPATPVSFPVAAVLERIADEFGSHAAVSGLSLSVVPCSAFVLTDRMLLQRALGNLVSNAIRYTHSGRVLVGCRRRSEKLRIEVWDTGVGIPEEDVPRIFEEFRQLGPPPRSQDKGFGLGLAIVERIVRLLGLEISVRSKVGRGSCFALEVPLGNQAEAPRDLESRPGPVPRKAFAELHVVCTGQQGEAREALASLLESWGCRVSMAGSAEAAVASLSSATRPVGLVIADHGPGQVQIGLTTVQALRQAAGSVIPGIVVCDPARRDVVEASGCGFLARPLQPAKLRAMMSHVLDERVIV
jgi:anti-sigma regulatory factor (Ser/Thr protein kinase)/CheY-like chemotaxis protein